MVAGNPLGIGFGLVHPPALPRLGSGGAPSLPPPGPGAAAARPGKSFRSNSRARAHRPAADPHPGHWLKEFEPTAEACRRCPTARHRCGRPTPPPVGPKALRRPGRRPPAGGRRPAGGPSRRRQACTNNPAFASPRFGAYTGPKKKSPNRVALPHGPTAPAGGRNKRGLRSLGPFQESGFQAYESIRPCAS